MDSLTTRERQEKAINAATKVAARHGIKTNKAVLLKDSNNTIIHLTPHPIVAKVGTSKLRRQAISNLAHELDVALHLVKLNAPIVPPSCELTPAVYLYEDLEITFWQYNPDEVRDNIDHPELVAALKQFHAAFANYSGPLKPFMEDYETCCSLLESVRLSPELSKNDRLFLRQVYERLSAKLQNFDLEYVPVHTEIHGGNVLWTKTTPLLIDFESCCSGPRELDFLSFSERNLSDLPDLNKQLMEILGQLRSFRVTVWCWLQPDRAPEVREAAEYHLNRLYTFN